MSTSKPVPGRAETDDQKRVILDRLLVVWQHFPTLRLGQLIDNARVAAKVCPDLFYLEDEALAKVVEDFVSRVQEM